ncbi:acyl-CoA carboxylase subunit beta [Nonomuraea salmonea]|jgi:acetyl-CoA carboxylase carboxyltransferase component|uniref:Acyl-CoA carboxylase subunit beta n=1 Tax=Nonomuraea salmonea TaxID=46181 RepID=A0ABV5P219_9ACTN
MTGAHAGNSGPIAAHAPAAPPHGNGHQPGNGHNGTRTRVAAPGANGHVLDDPAAGRTNTLRELAELLGRRRESIRDGDAEATRRQHAKGKLTARERIDLLLDENTFTEIELFRRHMATGFGLERKRPPTDGVIAGSGLVLGRRVFVYATDFRLFGGSLGHAHAAKVHKVMDLAISMGAPLIALNDGAGARIQEGLNALAGYGGIFRRNVQASGVIPQISVILGPCAGGAAYSPALTDFVFMVKDTSQMYVTGPDVIGAVTGESVTHSALGGAEVHGSVSGVASFVHDNEESCLEEVRYLLSLLPSNNTEFPAVVDAADPADRACDALLDLVPADGRRPYDMRKVIAEIVDDREYLEVQESWARNIICAFARIDGHVVGVVGNQPLVRAGVLDIKASEKAARFVRTCDAFNVPLVTLVDVPGFLPGVDQEHQGIIRHGAKLLYAYCEATVPRVQVILRKAYGGAYIVMDSRSVGADLSFAWPTNEIAVMGPQGAVDVLFRKELAAAADPAELQRQLLDDYTAEFLHPFYAVERGLVDDVIDPRETRKVLADGLAMLRNKREFQPQRKHGNIPL